jgi:hypothetical protein
VTSANASSELREWQTAAEKPFSKHVFAAVVAACGVPSGVWLELRMA